MIESLPDLPYINLYIIYQDTECEWLIESLPDLPYINLEFESIATECSYDYVFVFDGSNSSSRNIYHKFFIQFSLILIKFFIHLFIHLIKIVIINSFFHILIFHDHLYENNLKLIVFKITLQSFMHY